MALQGSSQLSKTLSQSSTVEPSAAAFVKPTTNSHIDQSTDRIPQQRPDSGVTLADEIGSLGSNHGSPREVNIDWDGPEDPMNPKNWTKRRKWAATGTVAMYTFVSPVTSSMVAPALGVLGNELHIPPGFQQSLVLSIFVLAYAVGPLVLGPMSEVFGRVRILQSAYLFFFAFALACGFAQTKSQLLAFRFISGLGGSAPLAIGPGVIADLWAPEQRGTALGLYTAGPLLGPAIGPIAGGFIAETTTWRWTFWSIAIYTGVVQLVGFFLLRETYAPVILAKKATKLNASSDTEKDIKYMSARSNIDLKALVRRALVRPFYLLFTQPIIQALAVFQLYLYGVLYIIFTTFPQIWDKLYHMSTGIGSLNYLSLGLGFLCASIFAAQANDRIYIYLKGTRGQGKGRPEFRVPLMFPASIVFTAGIFLYGWSAEYKVFWLVPDIGAFLFALGSVVGFQCAQTYCVDAYSQVAASAMSAVVILRSLAGFGFPLFAPSMYDALGIGWGNSLLGFVAFGVGIPASLAFWFFGERLRKRSSMARDE